MTDGHTRPAGSSASSGAASRRAIRIGRLFAPLLATGAGVAGCGSTARSAQQLPTHDPLVITTPRLLPHLANPGAKVTRLAAARPQPASRDTLEPPTRQPRLSADDALGAGSQISRYLADDTPVQVFLAMLVAGPDNPATATTAPSAERLVYDVEISGAWCTPSPGTTAPPGVTTARVACRVSVFIDADTGVPQAIIEAWP